MPGENSCRGLFYVQVRPGIFKQNFKFSQSIFLKVKGYEWQSVEKFLCKISCILIFAVVLLVFHDHHLEYKLLW